MCVYATPNCKCTCMCALSSPRSLSVTLLVSHFNKLRDKLQRSKPSHAANPRTQRIGNHWGAAGGFGSWLWQCAGACPNSVNVGSLVGALKRYYEQHYEAPQGCLERDREGVLPLLNWSGYICICSRQRLVHICILAILACPFRWPRFPNSPSPLSLSTLSGISSRV